MRTTIDLNCDLGESFGAYRTGLDRDLIGIVSSVNIACGFHAGDPSVIRETVRLALEHDVSVGAHPGLPDLVGFGRRAMDLTPREAYDMVVYQIGAVSAFARSEGGVLGHVKPHGALYNMAALRKPLAEAIAEAVYKVEPGLILFGLAGSELVAAAERIGLRAAHEAFADRTYREDGTLTPRSEANALIGDPALAAVQALRMAREGKVRAVSGADLAIRADTLCIHGDTPGAPEYARRLRAALEAAGIAVRRIGSSAETAADTGAGERNGR